MKGWELESRLWQLGYAQTGGVDEAGRGALAGPVVAAVVVLPVRDWPFRDSKTLTAAQRERLAARIKEVALSWAIGQAEANEVDSFNVLKATHLAAYRAMAQLEHVSALVTDFLKLERYPYLAVPRGDARSFQVAAASILAKTTRDSLMLDYASAYPEYGFGQHKGYGSPEHVLALSQFGPCPLHRRSFKPVAQGRLF